MDLDQVSEASEQGAVLELKLPNGDPVIKPDGSPVTITLAGMESAKWKKARDVVGNRYLKTASPRRGPAAQTMDELANDEAFQLASVTLAWDGVVVKGQEWPCDLAHAKKLYLTYDWIRNQVNEFVGERRNFWQASLTS